MRLKSDWPSVVKMAEIPNGGTEALVTLKTNKIDEQRWFQT